MEKCFLFVGNPPSLPYGDAAVVVVASLTQPEWEGNGPKEISFCAEGIRHKSCNAHARTFAALPNKGELT
jgi:hypothetical protein